MTSKQHPPRASRSTGRPPVGGFLILLLVGLVLLGGLYTQIPPATTKAHYTVTLGPPFRTDGFEQVVAFETLSPAEQAVFVEVYRSDNYGNRRTIHTFVGWTDRQSSPSHRFLMINYVQYRDRYYPVTTTVETVHTSYTVIRYGLVGICGFLLVVLLATVSYARSVPVLPRY
jgi:hypothetical protein